MKSNEYKGVWVLAVFLTIYILSNIVFRGLFDDLPLPTKKGDGVPWYFITRDFRAFLVNSIGLVLMMISAAILYRKHKVYTVMGVWITSMSMLKVVAKGIGILLNTEHILNPELATTTWSSFEDYRSSPWNMKGAFFIIIIATVLFGIWMWRYRKKHPVLFTDV